MWIDVPCEIVQAAALEPGAAAQMGEREREALRLLAVARSHFAQRSLPRNGKPWLTYSLRSRQLRRKGGQLPWWWLRRVLRKSCWFPFGWMLDVVFPCHDSVSDLFASSQSACSSRSVRFKRERQATIEHGTQKRGGGRPGVAAMASNGRKMVPRRVTGESLG